MKDEQFWEDVRDAWIRPRAKVISGVSTGLGGAIDPNLSASVDFDSVDWEKSFEAMMSGGDVQMKNGMTGTVYTGQEVNRTVEEPKEPPRQHFDTERFMSLVDEHTLPTSAEAFGMLIEYRLPLEMEDLCQDIHDAIITLMEAIEKFDGIYQTDISQFLEYYIPETLTLMASYMEYLEADIDPEVLSETETEVKDSAGTLLEALKDKKNELYQYGSMELKARSKALESLMNQDGHMRSAFKLNTNGEE